MRCIWVMASGGSRTCRNVLSNGGGEGAEIRKQVRGRARRGGRESKSEEATRRRVIIKMKKDVKQRHQKLETYPRRRCHLLLPWSASEEVREA